MASKMAMHEDEDAMRGKGQCCRCNGRGTCRNCVCAKASRPCKNYAPGRSMKCRNPYAEATGDVTVPPAPAVGTIEVLENTVSMSDGMSMTASQATEGASMLIAECRPGETQEPIGRAARLQASLDETLGGTRESVMDSMHFGTRPADLANTGPAFMPLSSTRFRWGEVEDHVVSEAIARAYEEQTKWHKNTFSPPSGHAGAEYVKEHTRLLRAYKNQTPLEGIALCAIMVMPSLLLQKPHAKAGSKEFSQHLSRRLALWKAGNIKELLDEARTIQSRLPQRDSQRGLTTHRLNRRFADLFSKGEIHAALSLITEHGKGGVLELTPEVREALKAKHPHAQPVDPDVLIQGSSPTVNPILFETLTGEVVRETALAIRGAAGPSMGDSYIWRRMLVLFKSAHRNCVRQWLKYHVILQQIMWIPRDSILYSTTA